MNNDLGQHALKILLHTDVSGVLMGQVGEIRGPATVHVLAEGPTPLGLVEIFRDGTPVHAEPLHTHKIDWTWTDAAAPRDVLLRSGLGAASGAKCHTGGDLQLTGLGHASGLGDRWLGGQPAGR